MEDHHTIRSSDNRRRTSLFEHVMRTGVASWAILVVAINASVSAEAQYQEAPMLAKLVKEGKLPPVEQRLPDEPMVVKVVERIGKYGGEIRVLTDSPTEMFEMGAFISEMMLRFAADGRTLQPNTAKAWKVSEDGRTTTIYLRKGLKWSDGKPVTVDDVLFGYDDVVTNTDITPVTPAAYVVGGEPGKIEKVDDYTFRFHFKEPYGAFPYFLTQTWNTARLLMPKHYLKQFHVDYTPLEQVNKLVKKRGFTHWFQIFNDENYSVKTQGSLTPPQFPSIAGWIIDSVPSSGHIKLVRNPYYWKVDEQGNQLPYIDRAHSIHVGRPETRNLKLISGDVDYSAGMCWTDDLPVYLSGREGKDYEVYRWKCNWGSYATCYLNMTHPDPVMRMLFNNRKFRIALSLGIDREELNQVLYYGICEPTQLTVNPVCSYHVPEYTKAHAEYDPDRSNQLLDELGLERKGKWRRRPKVVFSTPWSKSYSKLDHGTISNGLREEFDRLGISLSPAPNISTELDGYQWHMKDADRLFMISRRGKVLLFQAGLEFEDDLNGSHFSEALQRKFDDQDLSLSGAVEISPEREGSRWRITDDKQSYTVLKKEETLEIHGEMLDVCRPGNRILTLSVEVVEGGFRPQTAEFLKEYWQHLSILVAFRQIGNTLFGVRREASQLQITVFPDDVGTDVSVLARPGYAIANWAPAWHRWFTSHGNAGEEPPTHVMQLLELWQAMRRTTDEQHRIELGRQMMKSQAENLWGIGTVAGLIRPVIVSHRLHNVPPEGLYGYPWYVTYLHHPGQFYLDPADN